MGMAIHHIPRTPTRTSKAASPRLTPQSRAQKPHRWRNRASHEKQGRGQTRSECIHLGRPRRTVRYPSNPRSHTMWNPIQLRRMRPLQHPRTPRIKPHTHQIRPLEQLHQTKTTGVTTIAHLPPHSTSNIPLLIAAADCVSTIPMRLAPRQ